MDLSMGLIKADLLMAKQGITMYRDNEIKEIKNQTAYHLQQAAEKLIKIQIYKSGVQFDNKSLFIHNIKSLIKYADKLNISIMIPEEIRDNALLITDWEASGRYDISFTVKITSLEKYYAIISKWYSTLYSHGFR